MYFTISPMSLYTHEPLLRASIRTRLRVIGPLKNLVLLRTLMMSKCVGIVDISPVSAMTHLHALGIGGCTSVFEVCKPIVDCSCPPVGTGLLGVFSADRLPRILHRTCLAFFFVRGGGCEAVHALVDTSLTARCA